jgi:murein DD-endopeptidase MepM/ murein hydrolase activator NlpD
MSAKRIAIVFVPDGAKKVRQIKIPKILLVFLLVGILVIGFSFAWIVRDYQAIRKDFPRLAHLQSQNREQKDHLADLSQKVETINQRVAELREFDKKLRNMVNLDNPRDKSQLQGMGGSDPNVINPQSMSEKTHRKILNSMHKSLDNLEAEISLQKMEKTQLFGHLENQRSALACTPSIWPVKGWVSSSFGQRVSPFTGEKEFHKGLDICNRKEAPIVAPADGVVVSVEWDEGYGKMVTVNHGYGYTTRYAHLEKALVKKGQSVKRNQEIALIGNSGRSTGPHVHYELHVNGVPTNPSRFILN